MSEKLIKAKIILSDLHLSDGPFLASGEKNSRESFLYGKQLCNLIDYFSSGKYGTGVPVELVLNGDIFDFLNINYKKIRLDFSSEKISVYKIKKILSGHKKVISKLHEFVNKDDKTITYIIGNHDADFFFSKVRDCFINAVTQNDIKLKEKVKIIYNQTSYTLDGNIQIVHGHQSEAMHTFNYEEPIVVDDKKRKILKLPWGSLFVMNVVYYFKKDRNHIDKIHPISLYLLLNLFFDPFFTIKIVMATIFYYIRTRISLFKIRSNPIKDFFIKIGQFFKNIKLDFQLLTDGESAGREILKNNPETFAVIMGHTHKAKEVVYPDGRMYVNTGTWIKSISLDLNSFGRLAKQPFCLVEYYENKEFPEIGLNEWVGYQSGPFRPYID